MLFISLINDTSLLVILDLEGGGICVDEEERGCKIQGEKEEEEAGILYFIIFLLLYFRG